MKSLNISAPPPPPVRSFWNSQVFGKLQNMLARICKSFELIFFFFLTKLVEINISYRKY